MIDYSASSPSPPFSSLPSPFPLVGLARGAFENKDVTFQHHIEREHKVWNYLFFVVHLLTKDTTEFTGPETYVFEKIKPFIKVSEVAPTDLKYVLLCV